MARCDKRISIETNTPVVGVSTTNQASDHPYIVQTPRGPICAKHVVHATNGHVAHLLPRLKGKVFPIRGQMTVQSLKGEKAPANLGNERSWLLRHGKGYDYMTQSPSTGDYFLGGGAMQGGNGGHDAVGNPADDEQDFTALCHLRGLLPMMFEANSDEQRLTSIARSSWTGTLGFSCDGRPWVGKIPSRICERYAKFSNGVNGGEWIAAGYCGSGMVYCWKSGKALASMILGNSVDWFPESLLITEDRYNSSSVRDMANYWLEIST